jgi:branched-chain amino acid transport system substrate-binding protein
LAFAGSAGAQEVVKIGHVAAISGPSAHLGKDDENGARLAIEDLNAKGFKINGKPIKWVLMPEDDASDPKQGTAAAQKLVDAKVNGVVGHQSSGTTIPASKIYYDAGIPQISGAATNPVYTRQGYNTAFRVVANDSKLGGSLGKYAVQKLGARRIAVIDDRTAYGQGVATEFAKAAKGPGVSIIDKQFTNDKATDFNAILTAIKSKNPDLVFFGGMDSVGGPLLRQMKALGIKAKFMGGDGICTEAMPKLAGNADDIVTCAEAGGVLPEQKKNMDDFRGALQEALRRRCADLRAVLLRCRDDDGHRHGRRQIGRPGEIPALPGQGEIQGITGPIAFDKYGDIQDGALTLFTYKGGKKTLLEVVK